MSDLKSTALRGASWAVAARLSRSILGIVSLGILSRFLGPTEFGMAALVLFVTSFAQMFADFGTRVALVQRKEVTRLEEDSVYWSNMAFAALATAAVYLLAQPIARLMGDVALTDPLRWVAPVFLLVAMQGLPVTVLERKFAFSAIAVTEVIASLAGAVTAITMAMNGFRIEALIAQQLVISCVACALYIRAARWWPKLQFSAAALRPLLSYGGYVTASGMVQFLASSADRPIIGNRLSPADLGYLAMAGQIVSTPLRIVVTMVRRVMFPIMSSIQDDDARMRRGLIEIQYGLVVVMAPVCFGIWALAYPLVRVLLGPGWEVVAAIMGFGAIRALSGVYTDVNAIIFSAKGHAKFQFHWSIFSLAVNVAVLLAAVPYGIVALAAARLAMSLVLVPLNSWFAVRLIGMPLMDRMWVSLPPLLSSAGMAGAIWMVDAWLLGGAGAGALLRLAVGIPVGAAVYVLLEMIVDRPRFLSFARMLIALRRRKPPAAR